MVDGGRPCVVHLVRKANGEEPFRRFLTSYRDREAGVPHDLVLLFKGFGGHAETEPYRALAADVSSHSIRVSDRGYDLGAYIDAAHRLDCSVLCFLNSFSVIQAKGWLEPLVSALAGRGVGLAGATGSWGSRFSHVRYDLGLGGAYAGLLGDRARTRQLFRALAGDDGGPAGPGRGPVRVLQAVAGIARTSVRFEPFPAHHLRTNAFLVEREVIARVRAGSQRDKLDAYALESGRRSLTHQVEGIGLRAVVVGRDGRAYEREEWPRSRTFWQAEQQNLLVADNQTATYQRGDAELRAVLARYAWGREAIA